jgi:hypothetical protein
VRAHAGDRIVVESERVAQPPRKGVVEEVIAEEPPRLRRPLGRPPHDRLLAGGRGLPDRGVEEGELRRSLANADQRRSRPV